MLNAAIRGVGYREEDLSAHGFRTTSSSFANESSLWSADAIETALAHVEANDV